MGNGPVFPACGLKRHGHVEDSKTVAPLLGATSNIKADFNDRRPIARTPGAADVDVELTIRPLDSKRADLVGVIHRPAGSGW